MFFLQFSIKSRQGEFLKLSTSILDWKTEVYEFSIFSQLQFADTPRIRLYSFSRAMSFRHLYNFRPRRRISSAVVAHSSSVRSSRSTQHARTPFADASILSQLVGLDSIRCSYSCRSYRIMSAQDCGLSLPLAYFYPLNLS